MNMIDTQHAPAAADRPRPIRLALLVWGGAEYLGVWNYYLNMARVLRRHQPGYQVVMFVPENLPAANLREVEEATGEAARMLPPQKRSKDVLAMLGLWDKSFAARFREAKIDVVFEHGKFLGRDFPLPCLSWIGDLQHRHLPQYFSRLQRLTRDVGYKSLVANRDHVVVSSESARADLEAMIKRPKATINVVPFAIIGRPLDEAAIEAALARYELTRPFIYMPNQLWQHKNHPVAYKAIHELVRRGRPIDLVMSGPTRDYRSTGYPETLAALARELGIEAYLRHVGTIPHADLNALMAGANAVLNPSLFEGWSTPVEEAKSLAATLILSDLDVHKEQATGSAEFFARHDPVALADAIERTLAKPAVDRREARAKAYAANLEDQKRYARRMASAIDAAILAHRARRNGE